MHGTWKANWASGHGHRASDQLQLEEAVLPPCLESHSRSYAWSINSRDVANELAGSWLCEPANVLSLGMCS